jgi:hypothetical protein
MTEYVRENITRKEAECPHCKEIPCYEFLDMLQSLRSFCQMPLPFTSIYRCPDYNREIGGSHDSLHTYSKNRLFGAADIRTQNYKKRWIIVKTIKNAG